MLRWIVSVWACVWQTVQTKDANVAGSLWQSLHAVAVRCGSRNHVWLNVAPVHAVVVWQSWHVVANAATTWLGLVVAAYTCWWQETQSVLLPAYTPSPWHCAQLTARCAPVKGKRVAA